MLQGECAAAMEALLGEGDEVAFAELDRCQASASVELGRAAAAVVREPWLRCTRQAPTAPSIQAELAQHLCGEVAVPDGEDGLQWDVGAAMGAGSRSVSSLELWLWANAQRQRLADWHEVGVSCRGAARARRPPGCMQGTHAHPQRCGIRDHCSSAAVVRAGMRRMMGPPLTLAHLAARPRTIEPTWQSTFPSLEDSHPRCWLPVERCARLSGAVYCRG